MSLCELQRKFKPQPWRVSAVKIRALTGKEWAPPVTWDGDVWKDRTEAENLEPSDSQGLSHLRK